jgi:hypothetical protein
MASSGERRLLFDTRGKRRHVIRVVYAILALLMGGSLFLVIGPFNLSELLGSSTSGGSAAQVFDEQAERLEKELAQSPDDAQLLLTLTRARINAGNSQIEGNPELEAVTVTPEARADFEAGFQAWNRYLKQAGDEPNATAAQLVAGTSFRLAESSPSLLESQERIKAATKAQEIAADQRPSVGSLSTLAIYQYFNGEFAGGDKTMKQLVAKVPSAEAKNVEKQLAEYRGRGKQFARRTKQLEKVQKEFNRQQGGNPLAGAGAGVGPGGFLGE